MLVAIIVLSFGAGYLMGDRNSPADTSSLDIVEEVWDILFSDYVNRDQLDPAALSQGAIKGIITELDDPYTSYIDTQHYELGISSLEGEFDGIGAHITIRDDQLTIIAPIPDSPAEQAGIRPGDIVLEIEGETTKDMGLGEAVLKIRGPRGTPVRLLVLHEGDSEPEEIEIIRANIKVPSVRFEMKGEFAYILLTQFSERTDEELVPILHTVLGQEAAGIILDLRNNPGGLLDEVVDVASHFLPDDTLVVSVASSQETLYVLHSRRGALTTDLPMVILLNNNSASGSEVLAGALQDYGRAVLAGSKTFGKGSVNVLHPLSDGSGLYVTTARWLTPEGRLIEGEGIEPDYQLESEEDKAAQDEETEEDSQLEPEEDEAVQWAIDYLTNNR